MITRFARITDRDQIVKLLLAFAQEACVGFRSARQQDRARLQNAVQWWIQHHYVRVCDQDGELGGVIIAERGPDFWDPDRTILQERAWYMRPDLRGTRASARLWQAWQQDSDAWIDQHRVDMVVMSTQGTATDFDPGRRGWRLIEQTWAKD